jgi:NAD(P)-dependent dehydrogenase (short-subunit alcohol dehydrogenase family)
MNLKGRTALITGAGQGIGRACAEVFASRGADLVLLDKNPSTLPVVCEQIRKAGRKVAPVLVDLTDTDALRRELEAHSTNLAIDILVNNAGFDRPATTAKIDKAAFEAVLGVHLSAPLLLIQFVLPSMRSRKWGRFINVSSIYGLIGGKGEVAYSTAKAGVIGLTKTVAREAAADGVTVNVVLPGLTRTPTIENFMAQKFKDAIIRETPLGRMAEPEEIARVIAFLPPMTPTSPRRHPCFSVMGRRRRLNEKRRRL